MVGLERGRKVERSCKGFSGSPSRRRIVECRPQAKLLPRGIALSSEEFSGEHNSEDN